jgi:hypothetical protein
MTNPPNETMATAAAALTAFRVFSVTIVNMTLSFSFRFVSVPPIAGPDVL